MTWHIRTSDDDTTFIFRSITPTDNLVLSEQIATAQHQSRLINQKRQLARGLYGACPLEEEAAVEVALELVLSLDNCTRKWAVLTLLRVVADGRFMNKVCQTDILVTIYSHGMEFFVGHK